MSVLVWIALAADAGLGIVTLILAGSIRDVLDELEMQRDEVSRLRERVTKLEAQR